MSRTQQQKAPPPRPRPVTPAEAGPERGIPDEELSSALNTDGQAEDIPALVLRQLEEMPDDEARALAFVNLMMKVHEVYPALIKTEEIADTEPVEDVKHLSHEIAVVSLATAYAFGGNNAEEEFNRVLLHYLSGLTEVDQDRLRVRMRTFAARFVDAAQVVSRKL